MSAWKLTLGIMFGALFKKLADVSHETTRSDWEQQARLAVAIDAQ